MATKKEKPDKALVFIEYVKARKYIFGTVILVTGLLFFGGAFAYQKYQEASNKIETLENQAVKPNEIETKVNEKAIVDLFNEQRKIRKAKAVHLQNDLSKLALKTLEKAVSDTARTQNTLEYAKGITKITGYSKFVVSDVLSNKSGPDIADKLKYTENFMDNSYDSIGVAIDGQGRVVVVLGTSGAAATTKQTTAPTKTSTTPPVIYKDPPNPIIASFIAATSTIPYGSCTTISWVITGATSAKLLDSSWVDIPLTGSKTVCPYPLANSSDSYFITAVHESSDGYSSAHSELKIYTNDIYGGEPCYRCAISSGDAVQYVCSASCGCYSYCLVN